MKSYVIATLAAAIVLMFWSHTAAEPRAVAVRWEYKVIASIHQKHFARSADFMRGQGMQVVVSNKFLRGMQSGGAEGWELTMSMKWDDLGWLYYFKRSR